MKREVRGPAHASADGNVCQTHRPDFGRVASALRGRGARYAKQAGGAVDRLMVERQREDREAEPR